MKTFPTEYTQEEWTQNHNVAVGDVIQIRRRDGKDGQRAKVTGVYRNPWTNKANIETNKKIEIWEDGLSDYFVVKIVRKGEVTRPRKQGKHLSY